MFEVVCNWNSLFWRIKWENKTLKKKGFITRSDCFYCTCYMFDEPKKITSRELNARKKKLSLFVVIHYCVSFHEMQSQLWVRVKLRFAKLTTEFKCIGVAVMRLYVQISSIVLSKFFIRAIWAREDLFAGMDSMVPKEGRKLY